MSLPPKQLVVASADFDWHDSQDCGRETFQNYSDWITGKAISLRWSGLGTAPGSTPPAGDCDGTTFERCCFTGSQICCWSGYYEASGFTCGPCTGDGEFVGNLYRKVSASDCRVIVDSERRGRYINAALCLSVQRFATPDASQCDWQFSYFLTVTPNLGGFPANGIGYGGLPTNFQSRTVYVSSLRRCVDVAMEASANAAGTYSTNNGIGQENMTCLIL